MKLTFRKHLETMLRAEQPSPKHFQKGQSLPSIRQKHVISHPFRDNNNNVPSDKPGYVQVTYTLMYKNKQAGFGR